jgi:transcriptional regulator
MQKRLLKRNRIALSLILRAKGWPAVKVAKALRVHPVTVSRWTKRANEWVSQMEEGR